MSSRYHKSTCGYNLAEWTSLKGASLRFDIPATYGTKFVLKPEDYDDGGNFTHVPCPAATIKLLCQRNCHEDSIITAISGRCCSTGSKNARSACGVYFSKNSIHNSGCWISGERGEHTDKKVALHACEEVLLTVLQIFKSAEKALSQVVIKIDSEYLYRCATEYLAVWKFNGFRSTGGFRVENEELLREIDQHIQGLRSVYDVHVFFWLVPREQNMQADVLAKQALDEVLVGGCGDSNDGKGVAKNEIEGEKKDCTDDGTDDGEEVIHGTDDETDDGGIPRHRLDRRVRNNDNRATYGSDDGTDDEEVLRRLSSQRGISP